MHSLPALIAHWILRVLDPGWISTDACLIDGFELEALSAYAEKIRKQLPWVLWAHDTERSQQARAVIEVAFWGKNVSLLGGALRLMPRHPHWAVYMSQE
jgi:hypothetical protein